MLSRLSLVFVLIGCINVVLCARIFAYFPTPSISHQIVYRVLTEELAKRGHHLLVVTPDPVNYTEPEYINFTQIDVHDISYECWRYKLNTANELLNPNNKIAMINCILVTFNKVVEKHFETPEIKNLLYGPDQHFDICIFESFIHNIMPFKEKFNCSLIQFSSLPGFWNIHDETGNPNHPILYPDVLQPHSEVVPLMQKLSMVKAYIEFILLNSQIEKQSEIVRKKYFPHSKMSVGELRRNVDLVFLNYHPILLGIRPLVPAVITLGSLHITDKPYTPLSKDLQGILDKATEGAIYFNLGSNVKSTQLSTEIRYSFLEVFKELPYKILWKWENDTLPDQPPNVYIRKWFAQRAVLSHPNVKLFITQGGQQSLEEAIYHTVPLVALPILADQDRNSDMIAYHKVGKRLNIYTVNKDDIRHAVAEVFGNKMYQDNIRNLRSKIYDQPQTSLERAVWWTEYLLRHGGAQHLRSPAAKVSLVEYLMLDLLAVALALLLSAVITVSTLVRLIYKCFRKIRLQTFDTKLKTS